MAGGSWCCALFFPPRKNAASCTAAAMGGNVDNGLWCYYLFWCFYLFFSFPTIFLIFCRVFAAALYAHTVANVPDTASYFCLANSLANKKGLVWGPFSVLKILWVNTRFHHPTLHLESGGGTLVPVRGTHLWPGGRLLAENLFLVSWGCYYLVWCKYNTSCSG